MAENKITFEDMLELIWKSEGADMRSDLMDYVEGLVENTVNNYLFLRHWEARYTANEEKEMSDEILRRLYLTLEYKSPFDDKE